MVHLGTGDPTVRDSLEDEDRSSLLVQLSRDLSDRWSLVLRYNLYVGGALLVESNADPAGYIRHTILAGVRMDLRLKN